MSKAGSNSGAEMEYRQLGGSGLKVPVLSFGTGTFGGGNEFFKAWGASDVAEATRLVDICLEAGLNMFDTADVYSNGLAEEILGKAIKGRRDKVLISTKATFRMGEGPNDVGSSRLSSDASVRGEPAPAGHGLHRYLPHARVRRADAGGRDAARRWIGWCGAGRCATSACSNFSGWHLMKSLAVSDRYGWARYVAHQAYYSLVGREYEWELMPLGLDQKVGAMVWSPLGWGRLTGKIRRGQPLPKTSRLHQDGARSVRRWRTSICTRWSTRSTKWRKETGKTVPQIALNWLLQRPTVANVDHWRAERGAAAAESGRGGMEPDDGAGCETG